MIYVNIIDQEFYSFLAKMDQMTEEEIFYNMKDRFLKLDPTLQNNFETFLNTFLFWGKLEREKQNYEQIEKKAQFLKKHGKDFLFLYQTLKDYRSKKILLAILRNYYYYDFKMLSEVKETCYDHYFDLDLVSSSKDTIFVDVGAYTGDSIASFQANHETLIQLYASKITRRKMPVKINGRNFTFSPGAHNQLQKAIIEEFAPRFAPNSECLYVGDTIKKDLVKNEDKLRDLGFTITLHDKMPDVVLYLEEKKWLYFIESVTSVGPMDPKRIKEIEEMTAGVTAGKIYVTAFLDFKTFKKFSESLAWETEVWIADMPDHMIHLNGDRFLGPR